LVLNVSQCERKRRWHNKKLADDPDYRQNRRDTQKKWRETHRDYWQRYRETRPESVERNRQRQRERNRLRRVPSRPIANTDAINVEIRFVPHVRGKKVGKAVDLGCGSGDFARGLRAVAENVVGFDRSHGLIKEALSHPDQDGVAFIQGDILDEAAMAVLPSGDFDLVTAAWLRNYMHSEEDQHQLLREILRILGAGGCIVFLIPGDAHTSVRTQRFAAELGWRQAWLEDTREYTRGVLSFEGSP
jgi:SAM-dependent methyltransferase